MQTGVIDDMNLGVLYNFLGLRFATVGAKRTSTGCPAPLYLPLSEFVNTGGTI